MAEKDIRSYLSAIILKRKVIYKEATKELEVELEFLKDPKNDKFLKQKITEIQNAIMKIPSIIEEASIGMKVKNRKIVTIVTFKDVEKDNIWKNYLSKLFYSPHSYTFQYIQQEMKE